MESIAIGRIDAPDPHPYLQQILKGWWTNLHGHPPSDVYLAEQASVMLGAPRHAPALLDTAGTGHLPEDLRNEIFARGRCFEHDVFRDFPMAEGERLKALDVSVLEADFGDHPAGTAVARRCTNYADIYIFAEGWRWTGNSLDYCAPHSPEPVDPPPNAQELAAAGTVDLGELGATLAKGLAGQLGSALGTALLDAVFPPSVPSYFTQVYKEIEKIVDQSITQNTISQLDGQTQGLQQWLTNTYEPQRAALPKSPTKADKQMLYNLLVPEERTFAINVVAVLEQKDFDKAALSVFLIAASVHLALTQELALQDPNVSDPKKSPHATSVSKWAQSYVAHAKTTWAAVSKDRKALVVIVDDSTQVCNANGICTNKGAYNWKDKFNGASSGVYRDHQDKNKNPVSGEAEAEAARRTYETKMLSALEKKIGHPESIAASWRSLVKTPLP